MCVCGGGGGQGVLVFKPVSMHLKWDVGTGHNFKFILIWEGIINTCTV